MTKKISIDELEKMLNSEEDNHIEISANGTIKVGKRRRKKLPKVLTMRENLGGEYGAFMS